MSILPASGMGDESTGFYSETIDQSVRFNGSSSQLNITPSSTGNRRTFTTSLWVKRSKISSAMEFHTGGSNSSGQLSTQFGINSSDQLQFYDVLAGYTNYAYVRSNNLLRDTANWYHIVLAVDTTQSTASDRVKLYINGSEVSYVSSPTYPDQNHQTVRNNSGTLTRIGRFPNVAVNFFDGYMAEFNHIDGTALDPTSFGETKNGVWIPKKISGLTYGTNGFRLTFADSSSLGDDTSGNGNDFTSSGLSASGPVTDSPTNNFSTLNSIGNDNQATFSEGNLKISFPQDINAQPRCQGTFAVSSGKWYWEVNVISFTTASTPMIGIKDLSVSGHESHIFSGSSVYAYYANSGNKYNSGNLGSYGASYTTGDIIGVALDLDAGTLTFYKNNSSQGTAFSSLSGEYTLHLGTGYYAWVGVVNFGQDGTFAGNETAQNNADGNGIGNFYYSPPSGHLALCAANLPNVTIGADRSTQPTDHFNPVLYTGNGSSGHAITGVGFQPDWVWIKGRSGATNHGLHDSLRVISGNEAILNSNTTSAESTGGAYLSSFDSDGFTVNNNTSGNNSSDTYVSWNWKAGGAPTADNSAGAGNTPTSNSVKIDGSNLGSALAGTIPATRLSANTTAGFSIVTYTGTGTQSDTVAHGLGKKPAWYFTKSRSEAQNWHVYHEELDASAPENYIITLNASNAKSSSSADFWNSTAPTTSVVSVGDDNSSNKNGTTYVMYCFAEVLGFSKFGTYNGNSSTDGTYVFTGFRPAMIIFKATHSDSWVIADNKRDPHNQVNGQLFPDLSNAESTSNAICDFLSNGFKLRRNAGSINQNTYIYMAFAEQTFKFSNAR